MANEEIIKNVKEFVKQRGGTYSGWYCGITADPKQRLSDHKASPALSSSWLADSEQDARDTEERLLGLGFKGGKGGGENPTYVYVYKVSGFTRE